MKKSVNKSEILKKAVFIRELESYFLDLFSRGLLNGTVHTCVGQELVPIMIEQHLTETDQIFSNHRGHGHYIANNGDFKKLILELIGSKDGTSKGIGGSQHLYTDTFISNGIQGGLSPIAVGYSFIQKLNDTEDISVCYVGDGTLGEGLLYEALTLSKIFEAPILFVLENNGYAQSTSVENTVFGDLKNRFTGFGVDFYESNIWNIDEFNSNARDAVKNARDGNPTVLEVKCYRLNSHSKGDDNRKPSEIEEYNLKDPVNLFIEENKSWYQGFKKDLWDQFDEVSKNASFYTRDEDKDFLVNQSVISEDLLWSKFQSNEKSMNKRLNELINEALEELIDNLNAILIGEDIVDSTDQTPIEYGGAFKVTKGLSTKFPTLVRNTSISEAGLIGFGIGSALNKRPAIVEIMFGDFMLLCIDQLIQQASKIPTMYGKNIKLPLLIRTPMGGRRGYGPTHSQNLEKLFLFWPNIDTCAINCFTDPKSLYKTVIGNSKTTIVIEDKVSYTQRPREDLIQGFKIWQSDEDLPSIKILPDFIESNLIILTYGAMLGELIEVLPQLVNEEIFPAIISPSRISPINLNIFNDLDFRSLPLIFVEEGSKRAAWSSEVISSLSEEGQEFYSISRISNDSVIPCAKELEETISPSRLNLVSKILNVLGNKNQ